MERTADFSYLAPYLRRPQVVMTTSALKLRALVSIIQKFKEAIVITEYGQPVSPLMFCSKHVFATSSSGVSESWPSIYAVSSETSGLD